MRHRTVGDLMTSPALVAHPQWTVVQAAQVMDRHKVKRRPVVDEAGGPVGIVSRADLLRVFLRRDRAIRQEISGDVLDRTLAITSTEVAVRVVGGQVAPVAVVRSRNQNCHRDIAPQAQRPCLLCSRSWNGMNQPWKCSPCTARSTSSPPREFPSDWMLQPSDRAPSWSWTCVR
ncbi:CBS domain-containing protein [Streptomyces sp. DvalAA-14]|uniref:CBS domain-containing protein n=1 Tax=Streptomyces sp. DvalAA-14 TaxID=1839759 RepID=UPI00081B8E1E|nr:CBS domain-containing protein [Streptomyces sp. SID4948]SCD41012.1 CBS domain-containing protein [Streptomyces sp. DvalAA-14]